VTEGDRLIKWRNDSWALHHDVSAHTSLLVRQLLTSTKTTVIPTIVPRDLFLFLKMKLKLKRPRFDSTKKIPVESQAVMKILTQNDFHQCFRS
jgi:hypothetical protein